VLHKPDFVISDVKKKQQTKHQTQNHKKTQPLKQKPPARMKSLLAKKNFYNFKLLLALGGSRTKEAMPGNNSF